MASQFHALIVEDDRAIMEILIAMARPLAAGPDRVDAGFA
jgi:hypothetical protein